MFGDEPVQRSAHPQAENAAAKMVQVGLGHGAKDEAEKGFRRLRNHKDLITLHEALRIHRE